MVVSGVDSPPAAELLSSKGITVEVTPGGDAVIVHITTARAKMWAAFLSMHKATSFVCTFVVLVCSFVPV